MPEAVTLPYQVDQPTTGPPALRTVITGYQISSDNRNSQKKPTAGCKLITKLLSSSSLPTRVKTTTSTMYVLQFKYAITVPTVTHTCNGLIISLVFTSAL